MSNLLAKANTRLASPITALPCLWHRYIIEERSGNKWHRVDSGVSSSVFILGDGTGAVIVDPAEAEVIASNKQVRISDSYRHTVWNLMAGERLCVLGEHITVGWANAVLDLHQDVYNLIGMWKQDKAEIPGWFDNDGDDKVSSKEWEESRQTAHKQISKEQQEVALKPGTHRLQKQPGRLLLIANRTPQEMVSRYKFWAWAHLGLLVTACITVASLL